MIEILSVSDIKFSLNGVEHLKKFFSNPIGDKIRIYNAYSPQDVLLDYTLYSEIELDGVTYGSVEALQSALNTVIYSIVSEGAIDQDNKFLGVWFNYTEPNATTVEFANIINALPSFAVSEKQILIFSASNPSLEPTERPTTYKFVLNGLGKGTYGVGGQVVAPENIFIVSASKPNESDILNNVTTQFFDIPDLGGLDIDEFVNAKTPPYSIQGQELGYRVFRTVIDGNDINYLFLADGGIYGLGELQTTPSDFTAFQSGAIPEPSNNIPNLQEVTTEGGTTTNYLAFNNGVIMQVANKTLPVMEVTNTELVDRTLKVRFSNQSATFDVGMMDASGTMFQIKEGVNSYLNINRTDGKVSIGYNSQVPEKTLTVHDNSPAGSTNVRIKQGLAQTDDLVTGLKNDNTVIFRVDKDAGLLYAKNLNKLIVISGDSFSNDVSQFGSDGDFPTYFLYNQKNHDWQHLVTAVAGRTVETMLANYNTEILPYSRGYEHQERMLILYGGINDLFADRTAVDIYDDLKSMWSNARSGGFKTVAFRLCSSTDLSAPQELERLALNDLISSDLTLFDFLIYSDVLFPDPSDLTFFADGTHLNYTGAGYLGRNVYDTIYSDKFYTVPNRSIISGFKEENRTKNAIVGEMDFSDDYTDNSYIQKIYLESESKKKQSLSTGYVSGLQLSITAGDNTKFDIASGVYSVTDFSDLENITVKMVNISSPIVGISPTYRTTNPASYIALDEDENIIQSSSPFDNDDRRNLVLIGAVIHSNLSTINLVNEIKAPIISPLNQLHDLMKAIGFLNLNGNVFTANGANMSLNKSAGQIFGMGINASDYSDPHRLTIAAQTALTFRYRTRLGAEGSNVTVLDPTNLDVGGVITAVSNNNRWTIQHVNLFQSGAVRVQYGQNEYTSFDLAKGSVFTESFVTEQNIADNGIFRAYVILKKTTTNLTADIASGIAAIIAVDKFGNAISGGGSSITSAAIISALGYTPEDSANKATTLAGASHVTYPTTLTVATGLLTNVRVSQRLCCAPINPADATTFYIGCTNNTLPDTAVAKRKFMVMETGTLNKFSFSAIATTAIGTSETSTFQFRNVTTNATALISNAIVFNSLNCVNIYGTSSLSVTAGDEITLEWITPSWATNPQGVVVTCDFLIKST